MLIDFHRAILYALLCGHYCGYFTSSLSYYINVYSNVSRERLFQCFQEWGTWNIANPQVAQGLPYSYTYQRLSKNYENKTSAISSSGLLLEKAKEKALKAAKFARDKTGLKKLQTTDEITLIWRGLQLIRI